MVVPISRSSIPVPPEVVTLTKPTVPVDTLVAGVMVLNIIVAVNTGEAVAPVKPAVVNPLNVGAT